MTAEDGEQAQPPIEQPPVNQPPIDQPPIEPRPMVIRVLAALAIVAILGLSMYAVVRAGHNINKKVRIDAATTSAFHVQLAPAHPLPAARLRADAAIVQRRARILGYVAYASANHGVITVGTTRRIAPADVATLALASGDLRDQYRSS